MPEKIKTEKYIDTQPDLPFDHAIFNPPTIDLTSSPDKPSISSGTNGKSKKKKEKKIGPTYIPATDEFYEQITLLPPPSAVSTIATKALMREFKATMAAQADGSLPFWVKEDSDR